MSSSPRRAPDASMASPPLERSGTPSSPEVLPFDYYEVPPGGTFAGLHRTGSDWAKQSSEREAQARELGRQQGAMEAAKRFDEQLLQERAAIATATGKFARDCAVYYRRLEEEAVQLSLAIARKILHREAQVDPFLLMGIVRVALDKIDGATEVKLAIHPQRAADWRRHLASTNPPGRMPDIVEDATLAFDQCELRTSMGNAPLGIEVQLREIEQGLMDLLAARPPAGP
jgi:flagellar assembly protein FliH